ncbi:hypothetical protein U1Q18_046479 [Sarracenia purpurea var. burkii]
MEIFRVSVLTLGCPEVILRRTSPMFQLGFSLLIKLSVQLDLLLSRAAEPLPKRMRSFVDQLLLILQSSLATQFGIVTSRAA